MKTVIFSLFFILLLSSTVLSGESKVFTDSDLNQYKSEDAEEAYQYNQEVLKDVHQQHAVEEAEAKRREKCTNLIHPEMYPKGNGFGSAVMGLGMANAQLNAYHDCMAGVKSKSIRPSMSGQQPVDSSTLSHRKTTNCSSDFDCGIGYACTKRPYSMDGVCMRTVNDFGTPTHSLPRLNSGYIKSKGDCEFNTDCPIGFRCDLTYKSCVK